MDLNILYMTIFSKIIIRELTQLEGWMYIIGRPGDHSYVMVLLKGLNEFGAEAGI